MIDVEFERRVARFYQSKMDSSKERGIPFELNLLSVRNLLKAKRCYYTGVTLTRYNGKTVRATDITIERLDASKGYVKGNVVAACRLANGIKGQFENSDSPFGIPHLKLFLNKLNKEYSNCADS